VQPELKLKVIIFGKASMSSSCKRGAVGQTYGRNKTALSVEKKNKTRVAKAMKEESRRVQEEQTI